MRNVVTIAGMVLTTILAGCAQNGMEDTTDESSGPVVLTSAETKCVYWLSILRSAEAAFQDVGSLDTNGDGVGEYGTLKQLYDPIPSYISSDLASGTTGGYTFDVRPSAEGGQPRYEAVATPEKRDSDHSKSFFLDDSGIIRYTGGASPPTSDSPALDSTTEQFAIDDGSRL